MEKRKRNDRFHTTKPSSFTIICMGPPGVGKKSLVESFMGIGLSNKRMDAKTNRTTSGKFEDSPPTTARALTKNSSHSPMVEPPPLDLSKPKENGSVGFLSLINEVEEEPKQGETVGFLSLLPPSARAPKGRHSMGITKVNNKINEPKQGETVGFLQFMPNPARLGDRTHSFDVSNKSEHNGISPSASTGKLNQSDSQLNKSKKILGQNTLSEFTFTLDNNNYKLFFKFIENLSDDNSSTLVNSADGILFIFSLASFESFEAIKSTIKLYYKMFGAGGEKKANILVGTQCDNPSIVVSEREVITFAKQFRINVAMCSANENLFVDSTLQDLIMQMEYEKIHLVKWKSRKEEMKDKLVMAIFTNQFNKTIQLLTQQQYSPSILNKFGWAPIHVACWEGNLEVVFVFIQFQPDCVNVQSKPYDWTPLHCAARAGHSKIVEFLLDSGANVLLRDSNKRSAMNTRFLDIRELLRKRSDARERNSTIKSVSHIHRVIQQACQTVDLDMSYGKLFMLPTFTSEHHYIAHLLFIGNLFTEFPKEVFSLVHLKTLSFYGNEIAYLPEELSTLTELECFDMRKNKLTAICVGIGNMKSIHTLHLGHNELSYLPSQLSNLEKTLKVFDIYGNPLNSIPQDVIPRLGEYSPSEMTPLFTYLRSITSAGDEEYNRVKIMFVGDGNVGKTSLINCFVERDKKKRGRTKTGLEPTDTIATDGIDIHDITLPVPNSQNDMIWDCWDYAGQEIYYTTHQFFISKRSIYLICFNLLDRDLPKVEYWINSIHTRARGSPIILVGTHLDDKEATAEYVESYIDTLIRTLKPERFKSSLGVQSIKGIYMVGSKKRIGINELVDGITDIAIKNQFVGRHFPSSWLKLESTVTTLRLNKSKPFMKWDEFERVAVGCNLEPEAVKDVVKFLHSTGVLCYFDDSFTRLSDLVVLDPQFLTNVMASVITLKHRFGQDTRWEGMLQSQDLPHIWKDYPKEIRSTLMSLLEQFEIAFKLPNDNYIIPSLLPQLQPDIKSLWSITMGKPVEGLVFCREFHFEFLPLGFFSRLFIRNWHLPNFEIVNYWRNGQLLVHGNVHSLLRYNPTSYKLVLEVHNKLADKNVEEYTLAIKVLRILIENIETTIEGWYETNVEKFIPCSHCLSSGGYSQWKFKEEDCMKYIAEGRGYVLCRDIRKIRLDVLAPDLSFTDLKKLHIPYNELNIISVIGEGAFGTVSKANYKGLIVAVKQLSMAQSNPSSSSSMNQQNQYSSHDSLVNTINSATSNKSDDDLSSKFNEFQREVWIMSCLHHKNVCGLVGISPNPMAIIMDYLPMGDLYQIIGDDPSKAIHRPLLLDFELKFKIVLDIARGMKHLHSFSPAIIHRDLRSPNIFVDNLSTSSNYRIKVGDFGLSRLIAPTLAGGEFNANWLAPEVMKQDQYTGKMDVYSFAIIMWEILTLKRPFAEYDEQFSGKPTALFKEAVIAGLRPTYKEYNTEYTDYCQLMEKCWDADPEKRPEFTEIIKSFKLIAKTRNIGLETSEEEPVLAVSRNPSDHGSKEKELIEAPLTSLSVNEANIGVLHKKLPSIHSQSIQVICEAWPGKTVWSADASGAIIVWDLLSSDHIRSWKVVKDRIYCLLVVDETVWVGCADGFIAVYNYKDYKKQFTFTDASKNTIRAMIHFTLQIQKKTKVKLEKVVCTGDVEGNFSLWKLRKRSKPKLKQKNKLAQFIGSLLELPTTICVGTEGPILLLDKNSLTINGRWEGHTNVVNCMVSYQDTVWSGSNDGTIRIWSLHSLTSVHEPLQAHTSKVLTMVAIQKFIWTGSFDMTIAVWDPATKTLVQELKAHKDAVRSMCALSNNRNVWSGGSENDAQICIWNCKSQGPTRRV